MELDDQETELINNICENGNYVFCTSWCSRSPCRRRPAFIGACSSAGVEFARTINARVPAVVEATKYAASYLPRVLALKQKAAGRQCPVMNNDIAI